MNVSILVDRYVRLKRKIDALKSEADAIEGKLILHGEELLANTKYKSVSMTGSDISCAVTATTAETLKVTYPSLLKNIFGKVYADCVKEETTYTVNAHGKRILISLLTGAYNEGTSIVNLITELALDEKSHRALQKKLKGVNFDTDKKTLMNLCGMDEATASDFAYMAAEAVAWTNIESLMKVNGFALTERLTDDVRRATSVDQTVKVSVCDVH